MTWILKYSPGCVYEHPETANYNPLCIPEKDVSGKMAGVRILLR